jgi:hypothetical protein
MGELRQSRLNQSGDAAKAHLASEKPCHGNVICRNECSRRSLPSRACLECKSEARKAYEVWRIE